MRSSIHESIKTFIFGVTCVGSIVGMMAFVIWTEEVRQEERAAANQAQTEFLKTNNCTPVKVTDNPSWLVDRQITYACDNGLSVTTTKEPK